MTKTIQNCVYRFWTVIAHLLSGHKVSFSCFVKQVLRVASNVICVIYDKIHLCAMANVHAQVHDKSVTNCDCCIMD